MAAMLIIGAAFSVIVIGLSLWKPNVGRIFLGFFYILMGLVINIPTAMLNASSYLEMIKISPVDVYRDVFSNVLALNPMVFVLLIAAFQILMGVFILGKGIYVKIGLIGTILFVIGIVPLGIHQLPWLGLPLIQIYLLTKRFDRTFLEIVHDKFRSQK